MRMPIGQLMVERGIISQAQCERVLEEQRRTHRPFGEICEDMLGVKAKDVERTWAEQYASTTRWVNPIKEALDPRVRDLVNRRQAWQFRILPLGYDGSDLMVCTTKDGLVRAMNFATRQLPVTCYFVLSELEHLSDALMKHYPMEGMSAEVLAEGHPVELTGRLAAAPGPRSGG